MYLIPLVLPAPGAQSREAPALTQLQSSMPSEKRCLRFMLAEEESCVQAVLPELASLVDVVSEQIICAHKNCRLNKHKLLAVAIFGILKFSF